MDCGFLFIVNCGLIIDEYYRVSFRLMKIKIKLIHYLRVLYRQCGSKKKLHEVISVSILSGRIWLSQIFSIISITGFIIGELNKLIVLLNRNIEFKFITISIYGLQLLSMRTQRSLHFPT